ncbi:MAG: ferrous iron transport protein A [Clostridia bacterium]|nr:ferrous iron transport protein A [Clostridia bacterium]
MKKRILPLCNVPEGKCAEIYKIMCKGENRRRFLDLGMIKGTKVVPLFKSPAGDPTAYLVRSAVIAIRSEDAKNILAKI